MSEQGTATKIALDLIDRMTETRNGRKWLREQIESWEAEAEEKKREAQSLSALVHKAREALKAAKSDEEASTD